MTALENSIDAFSTARKEYRNALAHAVPYTVGLDANGKYQPGLKMHGKEIHHDVQNSSDIHRIAQKIEETVNSLNNARFAIIEYTESLGQSRENNTP